MGNRLTRGNQLFNLSKYNLRVRIGLIGIIPFIFFLIFAIFQVLKDFNSYKEGDSLTFDIDLIDASSALIHNTQIERGLSVANLSGSNNRKKLISRTLKDVEEWLSPHGFYRAHHSHLVNLQHIREFVRSDGGYLLLSDGKKMPVARNRKEELLNKI